MEDDGAEIPEPDWDDIFDYGYTTNKNGTGFGLSIVRDLVSAHGWTIRLTESSEGGVRFGITGVSIDFTISHPQAVPFLFFEYNYHMAGYELSPPICGEDTPRTMILVASL